MLLDPVLLEKKPELYWTMLQTAETVATRYKIGRAAQDAFGAQSQNRAAARDRQAAEHDYVVNLRAELEIMHLHDKVDALRDKQMLELLKRQNEAIKLLKGQVEKMSVKR